MSSGREARQPKRTSIVSGGRRKVHTTYDGGDEMVEEFDLRTEEIVVRKRRGKSCLGVVQEWQYQIGSDPARSQSSLATSGIQESMHAPIVVRHDSPDMIQFRIRNLPYPPSTYQITIDETSQEIVVRTNNKKYFKRLSMPDFAKLRVTLDPSALQWWHMNNTLIISYRKPMQLKEKEKEDRRVVDSLPDLSSSNDAPVEGQTAPDCRQQ